MLLRNNLSKTLKNPNLGIERQRILKYGVIALRDRVIYRLKNFFFWCINLFILGKLKQERDFLNFRGSVHLH
jgi:hypothetical protein